MVVLSLEQQARRRANRARYNATEKGKAAKAKSRAKYRAERKASRRFSRKLKRAERKAYPFVGCDGEGITVTGGFDEDGRKRPSVHCYALFRMGDRELFNGGARLTTGELLAFILDHPRKTDILVGFSFEYDITSILVDLPADRRAHLLATYQQIAPVAGAALPARAAGFSRRWTWVTFEGWGTFGLNWLSRNHLSVCRPHPRGVGSVVIDAKTGAKRTLLPDPRYRNASDRASIRTIYDVFGFFQASFVKSLRAWEVGAGLLKRIERMKEVRSSFETVTDDIRAYNADECALLAETMEKFRSVCREIGIAPRTWNGAGKIASFLHEANGTTRKRDIASLVPRGVIDMSHAAYYGGRFEITRAGMICEPVYEHDINSAYPAMMRKLPCLIHGKWVKASGETLRDAGDDAIFVCPIRFKHELPGYRAKRVRDQDDSPGQFLCGFPFRSHRDGRLSWPIEGRGVYWSCEIRSAERLGASCAYGAGWLYVNQCSCRPFAWVETLYRERKALGDLKGKPIKLGINALYGKLAQRIGEPQYANPVWAGLITACTRALLNDAIAAVGQRNVVMLATDAVYTIGAKIPRSIALAGDGLGEWSVKELPSLFVVQPGLYWSGSDKVRSRGLSSSVLGAYAGDFEKAWRDFTASGRNPLADRFDGLFGSFCRRMEGEDEKRAEHPFPFVTVAFSAFVGLRLAGHWGKPHLAGQWLDQVRKLSFDWTGKRERFEWHTCCKDGCEAHPSAARDHVVLWPLDGDRSAVSAHYEEGGTLMTSEDWEEERMLFEAMPDHVPLSGVEE